LRLGKKEEEGEGGGRREKEGEGGRKTGGMEERHTVWKWEGSAVLFWRDTVTYCTKTDSSASTMLSLESPGPPETTVVSWKCG
jgi:hypothetical protein